MKRAATLILAAQLTATALPAEPADGTWTLTPAFVSQYMFRGVRLGGPSLQPTVEYGRGGLAVGFWGSFPLKEHVADGSEPEVDFYGTCEFEVTRGLTVVPGINVYTYPWAAKADGYYPVTVEPSLALNWTVGAVQITPKLYYDFMLKGPTAELTASFALPLPAAGTELDFTGTLGTFKLVDYAPATCPAVRNWGDYWLIGISVPFRLPNGSTISAGWAYTAGSRNFLKQGAAAKEANPDAGGRGIVTLGYAFTF